MVITRVKVLEVRDLVVEYFVSKTVVRAVDGVSLTVYKGECIAIVGESGSGKSTLAQAIIGVLPSNARIAGGEIFYMGRDLTKLDPEDLRDLRGREISIVFQDPVSYLNPLRSVRDLIKDVGRDHGIDLDDQKVIELLKLVRIPDPIRVMNSYPFQLSGGMAQRVAIAIALALNPKLLIADEPTTALDLTIQAQIIKLLKNIKDILGLSIILITHDLGMATPLADRVYVMYSGKIVESGSMIDILSKPMHPYTIELIESARKLYLDKYEKPANTITDLKRKNSSNPINIRSRASRSSCRYLERCPYLFDKCLKEPDLIDVNNRSVRCWLYG